MSAAAIEQAGANSPKEWQARVLDAVRKLAQGQEEFTADDVWKVVPDWTVVEPRALGAVMRQAQRDGVCITTNRFVTSRRRHGAPIRVWRSLLVVASTCDYCGAELDGSRRGGNRERQRFCHASHRAAWHRERKEQAA